MQLQTLKFEKVPQAAVVLAGLSCLFAEFLIYRPNRLAAGEGVSLWKAAQPSELFLLIVLLLSVSLLSFFRFKGAKLFLYGIAVLLIVAVLWMAGRYTNEVMAAGNPYARIALGTGTWLMLFVSLVLMIDCFQTFAQSVAIKAALILGTLFFLAIFLMSGHLDQISLMKEFFNRQERFIQELGTHLLLAFSSVAVSALIGIPLGIVLVKRPFWEQKSFFILNIVQTLPSIALFGLLIAPLAYLSSQMPWLQSIGFQGIGWAPAVIALVLYSLLPIVRNTHVGFKTINPAVIEAARGMGMTRGQIMFQIELPLASAVILNGLRIAIVQSIGNTAVAALIGAGGLGTFIFQGLGQAATGLILLGAVPTIAIAVLTDLGLQGLITIVTPRSTQ